jgi:hypothetical protein
MPPIDRAPPRLVPQELPVPDEALVEAELARIETMEMSDLDGPGFEAEKEEYIQRGLKRALEVDSNEASKRKVSNYLIYPLSSAVRDRSRKARDYLGYVHRSPERVGHARRFQMLPHSGNIIHLEIQS